MSKDLCCEICAHFGIDSVENLVANRRNRFINRYGDRDNNYLRICQSVTVTDQCSIDTATHNSVGTIVFSACEILYDNALYKFTLHYITLHYKLADLFCGVEADSFRFAVFLSRLFNFCLLHVFTYLPLSYKMLILLVIGIHNLFS